MATELDGREAERTAAPINWYPGHMARARRQLQEDLKLIDVVVELVDARAPAATRNPEFAALFQGKARVVLLNKSDLADPEANRAWVAYLRAQGLLAEAVVSTAGAGKKQAVALLEQAAAPRVAKMREKGVNKVVRVLVAGIPNVGKSTFINRIAGQARAQVGDRPGITRGKQWVRITPHLELMDTPGLLWPKLAVQRYARHLAYLGSIRDEIMDTESLAASLLAELLAMQPAAVAARYPGHAPGVAAGSARAGEVCEQAEDSALAFTAFPRAHWAKLRTNNVQERANREIKRRYRVVQSFPSRESMLRLTCASLMETEGQWSQQRVFSEASAAEGFAEPADRPAPTEGRRRALGRRAREIVDEIVEKRGLKKE